MSGWFAMKRGLHDHPIFHRQPLRVAAWSWIVGTAAWKDTRQNANGKIVTVKRGQLLTSFRQMSESTGVSIQVLRTLLKLLQDERAINIVTNTGRMLITIENYDKYQSAEYVGNTGSNTRATREQHTKEQGNKDITLEADASNDAGASEPAEISIIRKHVWSEGKRLLERHGVSNPGGMIGRWLKDSEPIALLAAIDAAHQAQTQDPIPYITETLKGKAGRNDRNRFDAAHREYARRIAAGQIDLGPDPSDPFAGR